MNELNNLINSDLSKNNISELYKENTMFFYNSYQQSSKEVLNIPLGKIQLGGFYFLHYEDDSNWMKYSPVFVADFKKFDNLIVIYALNFNFIPLEIRVSIFNEFITKTDIDENRLLKVDYKGIYNILLKYGYEYALVEYNLAQVKLVHKIDMNIIHRFLYSGYPKNKYDPNKLYDIWKKKLETRDKRHQEMMLAVISDFYDISKEISNDYTNLKEHIDRVRKSYEKYGK